MAHLYVQQAGEAEWQGLLTLGRWHALPYHRLHICRLKESPQAQFSTKCLGLTCRASDHASTACFFFSWGPHEAAEKKGSLVLNILQVEKNGGDVQVWQDKVIIHNL